MAMINGIQNGAVHGGRIAEFAPQPSTGAGAGTQTFGGVIGAAVEQAHSLESRAQSTVVDLLRGDGVEVHDAMIQTQQAELAFELALQVRNKAVSAYQQMMQMQF